MPNSLKPILASVSGQPVSGDGISVAPQDAAPGSPAKIVVVSGGTTQDCVVRRSAPVVDVGALKEAESRISGVAQLASSIRSETLQALFDDRSGYSCEELRDPSHVSDYVSLGDCCRISGYREYPMRSASHNVISDDTVVCTLSQDNATTPVRTLHQSCKYVPIKEPLLTRDKKGDIVEVRIEYKRDEYIDGVTHHVCKCSTQRLLIKRRDDGCAFRDMMTARYVYANTSVATIDTEVRTTETSEAAAAPAKTRFQREGQPSSEDAPIRLVITDMKKTPSFVIMFNEERIVLYCLDPTVTEYRITSCKAIRSAAIG